MFIEWWERLRDVDRWCKTRAVIRDARDWGLPWRTPEVGAFVPAVRWSALLRSMTIEYESANRAKHLKRIWLLNSTALFALNSGDDFPLRYAPRDSRRIYIRERAQATIRVVCGTLIGGFIAVWAIRLNR